MLAQRAMMNRVERLIRNADLALRLETHAPPAAAAAAAAVDTKLTKNSSSPSSSSSLSVCVLCIS